MPHLHVPVDQRLLDALSDHAHSKRMSKAGVVREWLSSLVHASCPDTTPAEAAATSADAQVLSEAQGATQAIGFDAAPNDPLAAAIANWRASL